MGAVIALRRATAAKPAGQWPGDTETPSVTLAYDERHRRRIRLIDDAGHPFLLDLPTAVRLNDGDGLAMADGGWIRVIAAAERVADIRSTPAWRQTRIAWHLGNRHTPVEIRPDGSLRIRDDHVLVAMVEGLGGTVTRGAGPFSPEAGAYSHPASGHGHGHGHGHGQGHSHNHGRTDGGENI